MLSDGASPRRKVIAIFIAIFLIGLFGVIPSIHQHRGSDQPENSRKTTDTAATRSQAGAGAGQASLQTSPAQGQGATRGSQEAFPEGATQTAELSNTTQTAGQAGDIYERLKHFKGVSPNGDFVKI